MNGEQPGFDFAAAALARIAPQQPRTHSSDPGSSHEAEARSRKTWSAKHHDLLRAIGARPGLFGSYLADSVRVYDARREANGIDPIWQVEWYPRLCEVRKRLSDLATCDPPRLRREHSKGEKESRWFLAECGPT